MRFRRAVPGVAHHLCLHTLILVLLASSAGLASRAWAQPSQSESSQATALESIKTSVDEIEAVLGREDTTAEALAQLREKLNAATDALHAGIDELEPKAHEAEERLKQLGPAPAKDAPPESPEIAKERAELTASFSELDGLLKEARVLSVRIDQLSERVAQQRHALYARELFARTASAFDPFFWMDAYRAWPIELRRASALLQAWTDERFNGARAVVAALITSKRVPGKRSRSSASR